MPATDPRRGRLLTGVVGVVVSVALLAWAVRHVEFRDVASRLREARPMPLLAAVAVATSTFLLRALRWRVLVRAEDGSDIPFPARWHATAMGFMANNVLPLRAGELLRAFALSRLGGVRLATALTSLVVERVLDGLTLVLSISLGLALAGLPATTTVAGISLRRIALVSAVAGLGAVAAALALVLRPAWGERVIRALLPAGPLEARLVLLLHGVRDGVTVLADPARLALAVGWSVALWLVNALSFHVAYGAFGIAGSFGSALLLQGLLAFGIAVPSTPGFIGPFEAVIVAVLGLFAVPDATAFSYALAYHVTTFVPIIVLGLWSLARSPVRLADLRDGTS